MRHFLIFRNPHKATERVLHRLQARLDKEGISFSVTEELVQPDLDRFTDIVVMGGDGTINYALNHLSSFKQPLGILPLGTGNDYARCLQLGKGIDQQIEAAIHGRIKAVDLGQCNDRLFVNGFGIGFDGQIASEFMGSRGILRSRMGYYYHVVRILARFKARKIHFTIDDQPYQKDMLLMTIAKGTTFGGGFKLTPHSRLTDGQFGISLIGPISPIKRFLNIHRLSKGTHDQLQEVTMIKGRTVTIEGPSDMIAHIDGEVIGKPPFQIKVLPGKLKIRTGDWP